MGFLLAFFAVAPIALAQTIQSYSISPTNPLPGQAFTLTVNYCNTSYGTSLWEVLLNTAPTLTACSLAGQEYLVDVNGTDLDEKDPCPTGCTGEGAGLVTTPADTDGGVCTTLTKTWNLTLPLEAAYGGTYYLNIATGSYYLGCGTQPGAGEFADIPIVITAPPATILSLEKDAEGKSASTGDLVLFNIDYDFVNSPAGGVITDTVPPGVTFVQMGPPGVNPVNTGGNLSWTVPGSADEAKGEVWFLGKVTASSGTISNAAKITLTGSGASLTSNTATSAVNGSGFQLTKQQSANSLASGGTQNYVLAYNISGSSLQYYDSYNGETGQTGTAITGYGGATYTIIPATSDGATGNWKVAQNPDGSTYLTSQTQYDSGAGGEYPLFLRSGGVSVCNSFSVEGDLMIPTTAPGAGVGGDATMVLAYQVNGGVTQALMGVMSIDNYIGSNADAYLAVQVNNGANQYWGCGNGTMPPVQAGQWYTMNGTVSYNPGTGTFNVLLQLWKKGDPGAGVWTVNCAVPAAQTAGFSCNGLWQQGWQSDASSGQNDYGNLKLFYDDAVVNTKLTDTVPPNMTYSGSSTVSAGASNVVFSLGPPLSWSFPGTLYNLTGAITWTGTATCPGTQDAVTYINQAVISADSDAAVTSNAVTAVMLCATNTFTKTPTLTHTSTFTPTRTPTLTPTISPTNSPTNTPTNTHSVTPTVTPTQTYTVTKTFTPSVTPTNTFTVTATYTPTVSPTRTLTVTPTNTYTLTNTHTLTVTQTNTNTITPIYTPTITVTPTNTNTLTVTPTPTHTKTPTNTYTLTNTWTLTVTPSITLTVTPTLTPTLTHTLTNTPTVTVTPTWTETPVFTLTDTETPTVTVTSTQTYTLTQTLTHTETNTLTWTNTTTQTCTPTETVTPTQTLTVTPSQTPTETMTQTLTKTSTNTFTMTFTPTLTQTVTPTMTRTTTLTSTETFTPSKTPSPTATRTWTDTPTATPTWTDTASPTPSETSTPTRTQTPTPTSTFTNTSTYTFTATPTVTPTSTDTATATFTPLGMVTINKQVSANSAGAGSGLVYTLTLNVINSDVYGLIVTDPLPANLTFQSFGMSPSGVTPVYNSAASLMTWAMPSPLAPGQYQMAYQAAVNNLVAAGITIRNCATANYEGGTASTCVTTQIIGQYSVKIGIYNEAGELVESLPVSQYSQAINSFNLSSGSITEMSGPGSATTVIFTGVPIGSWNGTDSSGNPLGNGEYYVKVDSISNMGVDTSVTQPVIVNRNLYKVSVKIYNEAGEVVKTLYVYSSNPVSGTASQLQLSASSIEPTSGPVTGNLPTQLTITLNNGMTIVWDGTSDNGGVVPSGQYFIEASEQNGNGGETVLTAHVMVVSDSANAGMGNILAEPNVLNGATGYGVTFISNVPGLTLHYRVYDTARELVTRRTPGNAGSSGAQWDATGKASGLYFAVVDATNAQGGLIGYKILKIVVIH